MKTKIAGLMIFLAGTASVFAATHVSLNEEVKPEISGVAGIIEGIGKELKLEMKIGGLKPNALYVAKLESVTCHGKVDAVFSNGPGVAAFVTTNNYGSYSAVMRGLPASVKTSQSITLYSDNSDQAQADVEKVYCIDLG